MATAVQIELLVDEKGAVQGIRTFDGAIKGTVGTTSQLDGTLKQLNATLERLSTSERTAATGMRHIREESMSAREGVHLVTEEFGVEMPRAFKGLIAQSELASSAIKAVGGALIGIGAIQIGFMVFEQLYEGAKKFYEKFIDVDGKLKEFEEHARQAAEIKLFDDSGLQNQIAMLGNLQHEMDELIEKKKNFSGTGNFVSSFLMGQGFDYFSPADQERLNKLQDQADKSKLAGIEKEHQQALKRLEDRERTAEAGVPDYQRGAIERQFDYERADKDQMFDDRRDRFLAEVYNRGLQPKDQKQVPLDDGWQERQQARASADAKFQADEKDRAAQTIRDIRKLRDDAQQAELGGIALLEQQRLAAENEWVISHGASNAAKLAIDAKYYAEEQKLRDQQRAETEKFQGHAALSQFTGIAKLQAQSVLDEADINGDKNLGDDDKDLRVGAVRRKLAADIAEQERQYIQQTDELEQESQARTLTGLARIRAEAERTIAAKEVAFQTQFGQLDPDSSEYKLGHAQLDRQKNIINGGADQQAKEYLQHNADETEQLQAEAHAKLLSAEQQQTAAIETEYEQRTRKYQQELDQQLESGKLAAEDLKALWADYNNKVAAAAELRDAEMAEAAKQAREKLAGEFTQLFKNPLGALKEMGEKAAGETAASLWQRVSGTAGPGQGSGGFKLPFPGIENWGGQGLGGIFERIAGHHDQENRSVEPISGGHGRTVEPRALSLASAEIRIGMANISMPASSASPAAAGSSTMSAPEIFAASHQSFASASSAGGSAAVSPGFAGVAPGGSISSFGGGSTRGAGETGGFAGAAGTIAGGTSSAIASGIGNAQKSAALISQARSFFTSSSTNGAAVVGGGSTTDASSPFQIAEEPMQTVNLPGKSLSTNKGMLAGGGVMANAAGAATGAMGLYSAFEGNGGVGGALSGAMSGMKVGAALGGPIGAAIGAVGGAIMGAIGFGGREQGRVYDLKQVRPRLANDFQAYQTGGMDYTSAYSDMESLDQEARKTLDKMGGSARAYYWDTINKEIKQAEGKLTAEQKAGRSMYTMSGAQFDQGGWADDFGSMSTGPSTGLAHLRRGEFVVSEQPAATHAGALEAIRAGATHADMGRYYGMDAAAQSYRAAMRAGLSSGSTSNSTTHHWNIKAWDSKDVSDMLMSNMHGVRAANNASYAENSGGSDAGY